MSTMKPTGGDLCIPDPHALTQIQAHINRFNSAYERNHRE